MANHHTSDRKTIRGKRARQKMSPEKSHEGMTTGATSKPRGSPSASNNTVSIMWLRGKGGVGCWRIFFLCRFGSRNIKLDQHDKLSLNLGNNPILSTLFPELSNLLQSDFIREVIISPVSSNKCSKLS